MRSLKVLAVLVAGVMGVVSGMAQFATPASATAGSTAMFSVPTLIRLELDVNIIDFGTLTIDDYDTGYKDALGAQIVSVWSNQKWTLKVAADSATWTGPWAKPASDLLLRVSSAHPRVDDYLGVFSGLTTGGFWLANGRPGGNIYLKMDFRVLVSWDNDVAGDYSLGFTYTLTAP